MSEFFYNLVHLYDEDQYQALNFTPNTFRIICLFIWIGAIAAMIGSYYSNHYLGTFIDKLIERGADCEGNALTIEGAGCKAGKMLLYSLREGSVLRRFVSVANVGDVGDFSDISSLKFYIPDDKRDIVQKRFRTKGNSLRELILSAVLLTVVLLLMLIFGPWLLGFVDGIIK